MTFDHLVAVMATLKGEILIDVRSVPFSKRPGFGQAQLHKCLGDGYWWKGNVLGGRGNGATDTGLQSLASLGKHDRHYMLLCKEEAPGDCHRHRSIAVPLLKRYKIDCTHVYRDELI